MIPEAEWAVDVPLVEELVRRQHPDWVAPVTKASSGWDNAMFRLGGAWAVRLPRRALAVGLLEKELRWLPELAPRLPLPIPVAVRQGVPGSGFPAPWAIQPWLPGVTADQEALGAGQALVLSRFWTALHQSAPAEAPVNPFRGGALTDRAEVFQGRVDRLADHGTSLSPVIHETWSLALAAPRDLAPTWIHADLHPRNVLVSEGRLAGVLDWGDLAVGDPATDLASNWMLLETPEAQNEALGLYGPVSEATLRRALGWAVVFGVMFLEAGLAGEAIPTQLGQTILGRVQRYVEQRGRVK